MHAGDRILHPEHGAGSVLALKWGQRVRVRLDATPGLPKTFRRVELTELGGTEPDRSSATVVQNRANGRRGRQATEQTGATAKTRKNAQTRVNAKTRATATATATATRRKPTDRGAQSPRPRSAKTPIVPTGKSVSGKGASGKGASVKSASPEERAELRQTIEALRLGIVPARYARDYTVGRDAELASFDALLDAGRGLRALWGDYGHGKTHQLEVLERVALEKGYVTARVTLDPREVPPTHPKRLYRAVVSALSLPEGGGKGLVPLMHGLVESAAHRNADGESVSRFFSPYLHALHHGDDELIAWMHDYVSGLDVERSKLLPRLSRSGWRGELPLTLSDYRTYGRMYVHMLGTLACWIRDAGFLGLLLLFDEVEGVDQLGKAQQAYGVQVLKHFAAVAVPKRQLAFDPASHADLYRGGHAAHRKIPLRFRRNQPLSVVFAFTPLEEIRTLFRAIAVDESLDVQLRPLAARDTRELVRRVCQLYIRAYSDFTTTSDQIVILAEEIEQAIAEGQSSARDIVRGVVFLLDSIRLARGESGNDGS